MSYLPDSRVTWIVVHYSATPIERDYTAADIDEMHRARGFKGIGYHYFIRKDGTVERGRDLSQPGRFEQGAHSQGENDQSIGVCYEGGVRKASPNVGFDSRTPAQKRSMIALIDQLLERFPGAVVEGHRDMPGAATQCPGFNARQWWDQVQAGRLSARQSPTESKAVRTSAGGLAATATGGAAAVGALEGNAQIVALVLLAVIGLAFAYLMRDRLKKWAEGVR